MHVPPDVTWLHPTTRAKAELAREAGAGLPSLEGAILFLEHQKGTGLGEVDRALTQLARSGSLDGLRGVALGGAKRKNARKPFPARAQI